MHEHQAEAFGERRGSTPWSTGVEAPPRLRRQLMRAGSRPPKRSRCLRAGAACTRMRGHEFRSPASLVCPKSFQGLLAISLFPNFWSFVFLFDSYSSKASKSNSNQTLPSVATWRVASTRHPPRSRCLLGAALSSPVRAGVPVRSAVSISCRSAAPLELRPPPRPPPHEASPMASPGQCLHSSFRPRRRHTPDAKAHSVHTQTHYERARARVRHAQYSLVSRRCIYTQPCARLSSLSREFQRRVQTAELHLKPEPKASCRILWPRRSSECCSMWRSSYQIDDDDVLP
jgi:hypothetical protein